MRETGTKGFYYRVTDDKIKWWKAIPAKQKLDWLEEANAFLRLALSDKKKRVMEQFRKGEMPANPLNSHGETSL